MLLNFPQQGKINGTWIVGNPNAVGASLGVHFQDLWRLWDWDNWVKPQIDYALALGCNLFGAIGDVYGVANGTITRAAYRDMQMQLAGYLLSKGAYYLPCCANVCSYVDYGLSAAAYADVCLDYLLPLQALGNSVGVYVIDEPYFGSFADGYIGECSRLIKAGGCTLPRTVGLGDDSWARTFITANLDQIDFFSIHIFTYPCANTYLDYYLTTYPSMDVLIGSTGKNQTASAGTGGGDASTVVNDLRGVYNLAYSGHPRIRGVMQWSSGAYASTAIIADPTSKDHGLFDTNTTPGMFIARQHKTQQISRYSRGSVLLSKNL